MISTNLIVFSPQCLLATASAFAPLRTRVRASTTQVGAAWFPTDEAITAWKVRFVSPCFHANRSRTIAHIFHDWFVSCHQRKSILPSMLLVGVLPPKLSVGMVDTPCLVGLLYLLPVMPKHTAWSPILILFLIPKYGDLLRTYTVDPSPTNEPLSSLVSNRHYISLTYVSSYFFREKTTTSKRQIWTIISTRLHTSFMKQSYIKLFMDVLLSWF